MLFAFLENSTFTPTPMSSVLQLLLQGERLDTAQMAQILGLPESEIDAELTRLKAEGNTPRLAPSTQP
jgi:hypothetical protein